MLLLHRICYAMQDNILLFSGKRRKKEHSLMALTVSNMLHFWKECSMSKILHIFCRNIDFSRRGTAPLKGWLDTWKCMLHSFKGHGATFQAIHIFCLDIGPAKTHGIAPLKITIIQKGMFVLNIYCICWQAWGCCIYFESSSIFCRNCVLSKGPWRRRKKKRRRSAWSRRSEDLNFWTINLSR